MSEPRTACIHTETESQGYCLYERPQDCRCSCARCMARKPPHESRPPEHELKEAIEKAIRGESVSEAMTAEEFGAWLKTKLR